MKHLTIEYEEEMVSPGDALRVSAEHPDNVRIIGVTQIGPDLQYRYVVIWENGVEDDADEASDGAHE